MDGRTVPQTVQKELYMMQILFSDRLRGLLAEYDMKQVVLARKLNVNESLVSLYVNAHRLPTVETLALIAEIFHTTTDYLIGLTDERNRK